MKDFGSLCYIITEYCAGVKVYIREREEKRNALINLVKASVDAIVPLHQLFCKMIGEGISCVVDSIRHAFWLGVCAMCSMLFVHSMVVE